MRMYYGFVSFLLVGPGDTALWLGTVLQAQSSSCYCHQQLELLGVMFLLTERVSFLRPKASGRKINQLEVQKTNVMRVFSPSCWLFLNVQFQGSACQCLEKKQSLGFILVGLSDCEERDHLFSSCEVQVKVHSLIRSAAGDSDKQKSRTQNKNFISKMRTIPKQTRKGPEAKFHK